MAAGSLAGKFVDQSVPRGATGVERPVEVGDPIADMMNARAAAREKFRNRAVDRARFQEFHRRGAEGKRYNPGTVGLLGSAGRESEDIAIEPQRALDALDGDADVGDDGTIGHGRFSVIGLE